MLLDVRAEFPASMGPRSCDHGKLVNRPRLHNQFVLQWGRSLSTAESIGTKFYPMLEKWLQWGRGP